MSKIEKSFKNNTVLWLSSDDLLQLYPSQNMIWRILVDDKVDTASTDAPVKISIYGTVA